MTGVAFNSVKLGVPLVVDLDETLIKSDLLIEAVFKVAGTGPLPFSLFFLLGSEVRPISRMWWRTPVISIRFPCPMTRRFIEHYTQPSVLQFLTQRRTH